MDVSYAGIAFDAVLLEDWSRFREMDGPQYLWTRHELTFSAWYNPFSTSYAGTTAVPVAGSGNFAASTDNIVRHLLSQPRKALSITVGSVTLISLPAAGRTTDANNGPIPHVHHVTESLGVQTFHVRMTITFFTIETVTTPVVISHQWTMHDHISMPHYLTTRHISGRAWLRSDLMLANLYVPDDFRHAMAHPVGKNMQRFIQDVGVSEDGNYLEYSVVDEEQLLNLTTSAVSNNITKVEVFHDAETSKAGWEDAFNVVGGAVAEGVGHISQAASSLWAGPAGAGGLAGAITAPAFAALTIGLAVINLIPKEYHTITARVWGTKDALKAIMEREAVTAIFNIARQIPQLNLAGAGLQLNIHWERSGKFVEVVLRVKMGIERLLQEMPPLFGLTSGEQLEGAARFGLALQGHFNRAFFAANLEVMQPRSEEVPPLMTTADAGQASRPQPTNIQGLRGRGTFTAKLLVQVLQDAGDVQISQNSALDVPGVQRAME